MTAVDPSPARRVRAGQFGAARVRDVNEPPGLFDVALELSGRTEGVAACLSALDVGGVAVLAGSVSPADAVPVDPEWLVRGLRTVTGVHNYRPADLQSAVAFLAARHAAHPFAGLVEGAYALGDLGAAVRAAQGRMPRGRPFCRLWADPCPAREAAGRGERAPGVGEHRVPPRRHA